MCFESKPLEASVIRLLVLNPLDIVACATNESERVAYASLAIRLVESASAIRTQRAIERERVKLSREIGAIASLERLMDETEQRDRTAYRSQADREWNGSEVDASIPLTKPKADRRNGLPRGAENRNQSPDTFYGDYVNE